MPAEVQVPSQMNSSDAQSIAAQVPDAHSTAAQVSISSLSENNASIVASQNDASVGVGSVLAPGSLN